MSPDLASPTRPPVRRPSPTGPWLTADPARIVPSPRQLALQAFATRLTEVYALSCMLLWHPQAADQHCLLTWIPDDGWQAQVGTEADLARALHRLGMTQRAAHRQAHRRWAQEGRR